MNRLKICLRVLLGIVVLLGLSSQGVSARPIAPPIVAQAKINLNEADAPSIANRVPGIGVKRAEAIVKYRNEHGKFASLNDLAKVKGISERYVSQHISQLREVFIL